MRFNYLWVLLLLLLTACASTSTRSIATSDSYKDRHVQVFKSNKEVFNLLDTLTGLDFSTDKSKGESIGKIIAFINKYRNEIVLEDSSGKLPEIIFQPDLSSKSLGRVVNDGTTQAVRLQQAIYFYKEKGANKNRVKTYVPFEGADITALVKNGKLISLNSGLIEFYDTEKLVRMAEQAKLDFSKAKIEDNTFLWQNIESLQKMNLREFLSKNRLPEMISTLKPSQISLVFAKPNYRRPHELAWKFTSPYDAHINLYYRADETAPIRFLKSTKITDHVAIHIYETSKTQLKAKKLISADSAKFAGQPHSSKDDNEEKLMKSLSTTVESFKKNFNWNSYNNQGIPVEASINSKIKALHDNAAWAGSPYSQFIISTEGNVLVDLVSALDVIGHEYCHAVVESTAKLDKADQPGALNEHVSDIMGVGVQADALNTPYSFSIGRGVVKGQPNLPLRDFLTPANSFSDQPGHMNEVTAKLGAYCIPSSDNDSCGIHYQAGVPNLAVSRTIQSMGWPKFRPLLFNVITKRLRSESDFSDYRQQLEVECKALNYSENECQLISSNFESLGITKTAQVPAGDSSFDLCKSIKPVCELIKNIDNTAMTENCKKCGF